jgi:hypothetical protein
MAALVIFIVTIFGFATLPADKPRPPWEKYGSDVKNWPTLALKQAKEDATANADTRAKREDLKSAGAWSIALAIFAGFLYACCAALGWVISWFRS